jgi:hypothetical protein
MAEPEVQAQCLLLAVDAGPQTQKLGLPLSGSGSGSASSTLLRSPLSNYPWLG